MWRFKIETYGSPWRRLWCHDVQNKNSFGLVWTKFLITCTILCKHSIGVWEHHQNSNLEWISVRASTLELWHLIKQKIASVAVQVFISLSFSPVLQGQSSPFFLFPVSTSCSENVKITYKTWEVHQKSVVAVRDLHILTHFRVFCKVGWLTS